MGREGWGGEVSRWRCEKGDRVKTKFTRKH